MSAWIVSKKHIDYMVTAIVDAGLSDKSPDEIGRLLWRENLISVATRYPNDTGNGDRPGPIDFQDSDVLTYVYEQTPVLTGGALAKTLGCYDYQSCEHAGYDDSEAKRLVEALYDDKVPYDNDTPWGW